MQHYELLKLIDAIVHRVHLIGDRQSVDTVEHLNEDRIESKKSKQKWRNANELTDWRASEVPVFMHAYTKR